jgi:hypothetical protein
MFLRQKGHIYTVVLQLFAELTALLPYAIGIKWCSFEGTMNSSGHCVSVVL